MSKKPTMRSDALLSLLAERHALDVFIPECKDGPTQGSSHFRMDAWAMLKSWSNPLSFAYEIKVSRSDFMRDDKWRAYLPYCSEFYFVCPPGLIKAEELPPEAGLIYASTNAARLFTKKKSVRRTVEIPECVYRYILMCRTKVSRTYGNYEHRESREYWQTWLRRKAADRELGAKVGKGMRETIRAKIESVEQRNKDLSDQMKEYDAIKSFVSQLNLDPSEVSRWQVQRKIEDLRRVVPRHLPGNIDRCISSLQTMLAEIKQITGEKDAEEIGV